MAADEDEPKGASAGGPRQRPTVTIDLTAEDVRAKAASATPEPVKAEAPKSEPAKETRSGRAENGTSAGGFGEAARALSRDEGWRQSAFAGVLGGLVALVVVMLLQAVGLLPAPGRSAANQAIEQAKTAADATSGLDRRLTAVEAMTEGIPAIRAEIKALSDRVAALDATLGMTASRGDLDTLASDLAALGKRVDSAAPSATRDDLAAIAERLSRLEVAAAAGGGGDAASSAAITSLAAQLADAEAQVKALTDRVSAAEGKMTTLGAPNGGEAATRALAVTSLRRAAESGGPFAAEVDMVAGIGLAGEDIATLRPIAVTGVATKAALASEFPAVADAILAATAASDPNAGFFKRVLDSLVTIRPAAPVAGSDPPAIVSRMKDDAAKGDLAAALAERDGLPQAGKDASAEWAAKAADRVGLDGLIERIARALDPPKAG